MQYKYSFKFCLIIVFFLHTEYLTAVRAKVGQVVRSCNNILVQEREIEKEREREREREREGGRERARIIIS